MSRIPPGLQVAIAFGLLVLLVVASTQFHYHSPGYNILLAAAAGVLIALIVGLVRWIASRFA